MPRGPYEDEELARKVQGWVRCVERKGGSMATNKRPSVAECVLEFLSLRGEQGASLGEIYDAVRGRLGENTQDTAIRTAVYTRLPGANRGYTTRIERMGGERGRYRLVK